MIPLNVRNKIESIDYDWTKLHTYAVFIPGLSLLIQKIQLANLLPFEPPSLKDVSLENVAMLSTKQNRFIAICRWHYIGSITQCISCIIAVQFFVHPLFSLIAACACYELGDTTVNGLKNSVTLFDFYPNGGVKNMTDIGGLAAAFKFV